MYKPFCQIKWCGIDFINDFSKQLMHQHHIKSTCFMLNEYINGLKIQQSKIM